jgi:hypothetical protein
VQVRAKVDLCCIISSRRRNRSWHSAHVLPYLTRVAAVGPEAGVLFPVGEMQGSLSLRGYWEFAAQNRSSGWNTWLAFSFAPTEKAPKAFK